MARLSAKLRPISATQIDWAYRHCVEHISYRTKKGNITCSDCGHEWHSNNELCDSLDGCTCPKCCTELKVQDTRKLPHKETQYFSVVTTCKGYQLIHVTQIKCESKKGVNVSNSENPSVRKMQRISSPTNPNSSD